MGLTCLTKLMMFFLFDYSTAVKKSNFYIILIAHTKNTVIVNIMTCFALTSIMHFTCTMRSMVIAYKFLANILNTQSH